MVQKSYFKRYLELFRYLDWRRGLVFFCKLFQILQAIFVVQITASIISAIEESNTEKLLFLVKIFVVIVIVHYIFLWLDDVVGSAEQGDFQERLLQKYMRDYIEMDQTETDKF
jgi:ABC-type transport system involved in cytochrome bd biosynthesis fused ATPase/permease subunit